MNPPSTARIHDPGARYGEGLSPSEEFPGAGALHDLPGATDAELPLILARFSAVRAWALRSERAAPAVVRHALSAAREHLSATEEGWPERQLLLNALAARDRRRALPLLEAAATAAEAAGHHRGARALRDAAHRERGWERWLPPPSRC